MRRHVAVRVVGPMQWIVYPALMTIAATILLATPIQFFGRGLPEPILPMVLAFAWPLIRPSIVAPLVLTALGLGLDIFMFGPLGLWALALLAIYAVALASRSILTGQETAVLFVWYAACCCLAFLMVYLVRLALDHNGASILAVMGQVIPTLLLFPFADRMIEQFEDGDVRFR